MPIFGMKTPRGAFLAIVKGLKFEQTPMVKAVNGKYTVFPRFFISDPDCNTRNKITRTIAFNPYEDIVVDFFMCAKICIQKSLTKDFALGWNLQTEKVAHSGDCCALEYERNSRMP